MAEENYFFKLSKYQGRLIKLINSDELKIVPETRKNEILSFLSQPLQDISISRTNERAKNWGVPVPGDPNQRIYVWFDALNIYQSGIGFGWDEDKYKKYWPADVHAIGKGISRFHTIYWPAFLLSAELALPKTVFVHGYLTVNGQKMSKSLGNAVDPNEFIEKYGADALRYYLLAKVSPFADGDFSEEKLKETYNSDLANGLGNLIARIAKLCETSGAEIKLSQPSLFPEVEKYLQNFRFDSALKAIWDKIKILDQEINDKKFWELKGDKLKTTLDASAVEIRNIAYNLKPFLPETSEKILSIFGNKPVAEILFPRK